MFLQSSYIPKEKQIESRLGIADIAVLAAQIGDRPMYSKGRLEHLTAGKLQLICYWAQGMYIATRGKSLFPEDFRIIGGRIENQRITELFGPFSRVVTPFEMTDVFRKSLSTKEEGFNAETNMFAQEIIYDMAPRDYDAVMERIRKTEPYIKALTNPDGVIRKADMKEYFEGLVIRPVKDTWTLED